LPPVKIVRQFELQADIEDLYTRRSRQPRLLSLDLRAQIAAHNVARSRILESIERYGEDTVKTVMRNVMDRAETQLRARLREIPDGTWRHVDFQEVSGAGDRGVYAAHLEMTKTGDHLHFDFTGTDRQAGIINSASAGARAGVFAALLPVLVGEIPWAACSVASASSIRAAPSSTPNIRRPSAWGRSPAPGSPITARMRPSPRCC
jgi:N-methylhydantoinase B